MEPNFSETFNFNNKDVRCDVYLYDKGESKTTHKMSEERITMIHKVVIDNEEYKNDYKVYNNNPFQPIICEFYVDDNLVGLIYQDYIEYEDKLVKMDQDLPQVQLTIALLDIEVSFIDAFIEWYNKNICNYVYENSNNVYVHYN